MMKEGDGGVPGGLLQDVKVADFVELPSEKLCAKN